MTNATLHSLMERLDEAVYRLMPELDRCQDFDQFGRGLSGRALLVRSGDGCAIRVTDALARRPAFVGLGSAGHGLILSSFEGGWHASFFAVK